ncbi:MAG: bacteriohemerythrin [Gammaproteobacteria bacterium]
MATTGPIDIFPWNENFNTGVSEIDEQHKKLVQLLNVLASHMAFHSDLPSLNAIFDELSDYAEYHFQTEEAIWHRYLPEDLLETKHKQIHKSFKKNIQALRTAHTEKTIEKVLEQVLAFLSHWLASHILESDRHLAMVVEGVRSGMPLEAAKRQANEKMGGTTRALIDIILSIYESLSANTLLLMRELSQRKRDEESLRKLSLAVQQSPSSIVITNLDANIEFVNEAFLNATGYSRAEIIDQNPRFLQSGKTPQATYGEMWDSLTQGRIWKGEFINRRKDGSEYTEIALISPVKQPDGIVTHYLAIKEDITDRKNLERHLFEQLTFNQSIIEGEVNGIAVCHPIAEAPYVRFTVWNPSMQLLTGFTMEEINRLGWYQTVYKHPKIQQRAKRRMQRMYRGHHLHAEEWTITRKTGEQRIVQISTVSCAAGQTENHVLAVLHDITQRKQAEEAAFRAAQYARSLIEASLDPLVTISTDGKITDVNTATEQATGLGRTTLIGSDFAIYFTDPKKARAGYEQAFSQGFITDFPLAIRHSSGKITDVLYNATVYRDINGEVLGVFAAARDITRRKRAEAAAVRSAEYARSLIEASLDPLVTISVEGKITDVNSATEKVTGLDRSDLIGSVFTTYFTDPEKARTGYEQAFSQGYITDYPLAIRHISGKITDVLYNANVFRDTNGKVIGVLAAARDITERKRIEARLIESESRLRTIIENEPECIKIVDAKGILRQINPAGLKMLEADDLEQVIGRSVTGVIAPEYQTDFAELHRRVIAGEPMQLEYEVIGLKGRRRWLDTHAVPMKDANGEVVHLAVTRDIHERKQAEHQLRLAATVFESQECMMVTDAKNNILRVNQAFTETTGYTTEDVFGKNPKILHSKRHPPEFYTSMWKSITKNGCWEGEIWNQRKSGEIFPAQLSITSVKDQNGLVTHYVGTLTDITQKKAAAEEIERLAFYDPLTGLPNRRLLQDRLKQVLASSERSGRHGALLFIDLDNFKSLNDTLGHDMGDLLLQKVAKRLSTCVREVDTVARLGGDEFVVLTYNLDEFSRDAVAHAEIVGKKIVSSLNKPFKLEQHDYVSTPSIGIALFKGHTQSADDLLKQADIAMYQAKLSGRNAIRFFDPQMQEAIVARVSLEDDLRKALCKRQFQLYYQIQVERESDIVGAEALIRWPHPERGLISPKKFIPLAEETGLIVPMGEWVLETACAQLKAWQQMPISRKLTLSVNVSPKQFFQTNFISVVKTAIQDHDIDPRLLKLELTENILIENIENTIAVMDALGAIGVQFSLDDFGTGYSSLQYLKKLPLSQLKIDQSFIRDIAIDVGDQAIVRTIIAMAHSLNLSVIAEGVETEKQRQFLVANGCSSYQGYLFGKPLPLDQFTARLNAPERS